VALCDRVRNRAQLSLRLDIRGRPARVAPAVKRGIRLAPRDAMPKKSTRRATTMRMGPAGHAGHEHGGLGEKHVHPVFFSEFLHPAIRAKHVRLPDWVYLDVCRRKDQEELTETERSRFLCALNVLIANGTFGQLVDIHAEPHQMHHTARFLPWHRVYLWRLEEALHQVHPDVCLPYWDWTKASQQTIPAWLASVTPTVVTPTRTIAVMRAPQSSASLGMIAANAPAALAQSTFASFASQLESIHDSVHVWVGGSMAVVSTAPADPLFWMHHANIDRLWWQWQQSSQGSGKNPPLAGAAAVMDPWPQTEPDTRDIANFGYVYV
jgi:tyrosinase